MHAFDEDTAVVATGEGTWRGSVTERWDVGTNPNGGYLLAIAMSALREAMPGLDPLTVTAHYLGRAGHGATDLQVDVLKRGRSTSTATVRMLQAGRVHLAALATYGALEAAPDAPRFVDSRPPEVPPPDGPTPDRGAIPLPAIAKMLDLRIAPETVPWARGERGEHAEIRGRVRFADGREPDVHSLGLLADALPPPVFSVITPGWVPTIELTVHVRARPRPGWLLCRFSTRFAFGGWLEEDGEIWDESGELVALSRQLAAVPRMG